MDNYYNSKEFKEVLGKYESLQDDDDALSVLGTDDFSDIAQYYHEKGDDKKALHVIDTALNIYPGSVGPMSFLSRFALLEEQDIDKAKKIADGIADKEDPDYFLLNAEIMIVDGKADEADAFLDDAYANFYGDDYYDDMPLDVAILFSDYEEMDYAEKWLKLSDEGDEPDYKLVKAKILLSRDKIDEGEKIINELINSDPYSTTYWNVLAAAQAMDDKVEDSITSSDYALAIDPNDRDALLNKASSLEWIGNYTTAEQLYRRYTKLEPNKIVGYIDLAFVLLAQERMQEALGYFKKALAVVNNMPKSSWKTKVDIIFQMSYIENYLDHFSKAHEYLDQIADLFKDNLGSDLDEMGRHLADVDCAQGHICLEEEKIDAALDWFDQAVNDSDGSPRIYSKIARSAYESGYVQYAYNILHELIYNQGEDEPLGLSCLVECCKHLGKAEEQKWAEAKLAEQKKSQEK